MGANKRDYMDYHAHATLEDIINKYNLDAEEQMWYETLCDNKLKDIEQAANVTKSYEISTRQSHRIASVFARPSN